GRSATGSGGGAGAGTPGTGMTAWHFGQRTDLPAAPSGTRRVTGQWVQRMVAGMGGLPSGESIWWTGMHSKRSRAGSQATSRRVHKALAARSVDLAPRGEHLAAGHADPAQHRVLP